MVARQQCSPKTSRYRLALESDKYLPLLFPPKNIQSVFVPDSARCSLKVFANRWLDRNAEWNHVKSANKLHRRWGNNSKQKQSHRFNRNNFQVCQETPGQRCQVVKRSQCEQVRRNLSERSQMLISLVDFLWKNDLSTETETYSSTRWSFNQRKQ